MEQATEPQPQPHPEGPEILFANISGDNEPTVMESICVQCEKQGKTTLMLTKIPMFKELIVTSFYCEECGYKNTDVQFGGKLGDFGSNISLKVTSMDDFKRDVVRSEYSTIEIPELGFKIPTNKKGQVNTIEGFIRNTIEDLESEQEKRKLLWPDLHKQIGAFMEKLEEMLEGKHFPFHFIVDDPAGNSFIKNLYFPKTDPNLIVKERVRSKEECEEMGFSIDNEQFEQEQADQQKQLDEKIATEGKEQESHIYAHKIDYTKPFDEDRATDGAIQFPITCHCCMKEGVNNMCVIDIPFFKEVTIMSFNCDFCGAKNSDVKVGGGISDQGVKIVLDVKSPEDMKRDLFKSDTCGVNIPILGVEMSHGTLGGVYTTVEGLLEKIEDNLCKNNPFVDSDQKFRDRLDEIQSTLQNLREGTTPFQMILEDMLENSFIQNPCHPNQDPNCVAEKFDRTNDMNEELGLNDMKV